MLVELLDQSRGVAPGTYAKVCVLLCLWGLPDQSGGVCTWHVCQGTGICAWGGWGHSGGGGMDGHTGQFGWVVRKAGLGIGALAVGCKVLESCPASGHASSPVWLSALGCVPSARLLRRQRTPRLAQHAGMLPERAQRSTAGCAAPAAAHWHMGLLARRGHSTPE